MTGSGAATARSKMADNWPRWRNFEFWVSFFIALGLFLLYMLVPSFIDGVADASKYVAIAQGEIQSVKSPFSNRAGIPMTVGLISEALGIDLKTGFASVSAVAAFIFYYSIFAIVRDGANEMPKRLVVALIAVPFLWFAFAYAAMPEPVGFALTAAALRQLQMGRYHAGILIIGCAMATRETYGLLLIFICVWMLHRKDWAKVMLSLGVGTAAFALVSHFAKLGAPNVHEMNQTLYMIMKIPFNFMRGILGIEIWTDGFKWCDTPQFVADVPKVVRRLTGKIGQVGICGVDPRVPLLNLYMILSVFGSLTAMVALALRRWCRLANRRRYSAAPGWLVICVVYGALAYILGLLTGAATYRLLAYGWPLFLIAGPILWMSRTPYIPLTVLALHAGFLFSLFLIAPAKENNIALAMLVLISVSLTAASFALYRWNPEAPAERRVSRL